MLTPQLRILKCWSEFSSASRFIGAAQVRVIALVTYSHKPSTTSRPDHRFFCFRSIPCGFPKVANQPLRIMSSSPTFEISAADCSDIPRLAHIHVDACLPDNAFALYFATAQEFEARVTEMLEGQVGDPTWQHIKAIDKSSGILAAWAS